MFLYLRFWALLPPILFCFDCSFAQNNFDNTKAAPITESLTKLPRLTGITQAPPHRAVTSIRVALRSQAFNFPVNDCFTYTYKLTVSNGGKVLQTKDLFTASDNNTYLAGSAENNGQQDGLIQQLDVYGNIAWSKCIGRPDREEIINSVRQLSSGDLILVGTSASPGGTGAVIFLAELSTSGNLLWFKTLDGLSGYNGLAVSPFQNAIGFAGSDDSTIVYGRIDFSGNAVWLKKIRLMEKGSVIGMTNDDYDRCFISYSGIDSSHYVMAVAGIDLVDGRVLWANRYGGMSQNSDFIIHDHQLVNIRNRLSGIYSEGGGQYKLFKMTINGLGTTETMQVFATPGLTIQPSARTALAAWAETFAFSASDTDPDVYVFGTVNEAYPDTLIAWKKRFTAIGSHQLVALNRAFDGGYLVSANLSSNQQFILKTDSVGTIRNCEGQDFELHDSMKYYNTRPPQIQTFLSSPGAMVSDNPVVTDLSLQTSYACKELYCPPQPYENACLSTFARKYQSVSICDLATDLIVSHNNDIILTGLTRDDPYNGAGDRAFLASLDAKGKLLTRKKITLGNGSAFIKMFTARDGNFFVIGSSRYRHAGMQYDTAYYTISKFTPGLQLLWNTSFPVYAPYSAIHGLVEAADGSIFIHYIEGRQMCEDIDIIKLNSQGVLQWVKGYLPANSCAFGYHGSMIQDEDYLYAITYANPGDILMKISKATGDVVWTRSFNVPGKQTEIGENLSFLGDNLVVHGSAWSNGSQGDVVIMVDKNGNLKKYKTYAYIGTMMVTANQQMVFMASGYPYTLFWRVDSNFNLINAKQLTLGNAGIRSLKESADGGIYAAGLNWQSNVYLTTAVLMKFTHDGLMGNCFADTFMVKNIDFEVVANPVSTSVVPVQLNMESLPYTDAPYSLQQNDLLCSAVSLCDKIAISASPQVCDTLVHTVKITRNPGCSSAAVFQYSNPVFRVISRTDTSMNVQFIKSGATKIKSRIFTGCVWVEDSLVVNSSITTGKIDLGADTSICPGNALLLKAGDGFPAYQWQDASTDSVYTVTQPGKYFVEAVDACGNKFSDTVMVIAHAPIPLDLGADRTKCNNDTLHLNAPPGFSSYSWSNNYNISSLTSQNVIVDPLSDTAYFIKAEKTPGCFAFDTVRIHVNTSPLINLGQDKSLCNGDSAIFDAGSGYAQYTWSNGATSQQLTANGAGSYSVMATTAQGCKSYDTVSVVNVFTNPVVTLDHNHLLCAGASRILDAGSFSSYQWNDGSTSQKISIKNTGIYAVQVTDNHGCKGSDTTIITAILPLPSDFLPSDTLLCSYDKLTLSSKSAYKSYQWYNGASASSIEISQPGIYWLQVKDADGCVGRDSSIVNPKDCIKGIYVPTAFTPNKDSRNDSFKPLLFGNVKNYQFTIYNRWGQMVFQTTELNRSWDGTVAGTAQDPNVFVWVCTYQFEGDQVKTAKGTVTLIR